MGLVDLFLSLKTPALLLLTIFGPSLLPRLLQFLRLRPPPPARTRSHRRPLSTSTKALLALWSLYWIYQLLVPPFDVFVSYNLPITTTQEVLRRVLLRPPKSSVSPALLLQDRTAEILLTRLANLDYRILYARFGHTPLSSCTWCRSREDYLLVALPGIIFPYLLTAVIIGVMGWSYIGGIEANNRSDRWRSTFGWALCAMGGAEVGSKYFWDLRIFEGDCLHLASTIHTLRSILVLAFPTLYALLPISPPPTAQLNQLLVALANIAQSARLTAVARETVAANPRIRDQWVAATELQRRNVAFAMQDPAVVERVQVLGLTNEVLGPGARQWIQMGWNGLMGGFSVHEEPLRPS